MRDNVIVALSLIIVGLIVHITARYIRDRKRHRKDRQGQYAGHFHKLRATILGTDDLDTIPDLENQILDLFNAHAKEKGADEDMCKLFELLDGREKYLYQKLSNVTHE